MDARRLLAGLLIPLLAAGAHAHGGEHGAGAEAEGTPLAPGYAPLAFPAPEPGSYALPPLGPAGDGRVLGPDGSASRLHAELGPGAAVLGLIYLSCSDANGCPLALAVFDALRRRLADRPELASRVRLVALSFDPARDTPEAMRRQSEAFGPGPVEWRFLTTASPAELAPILEAYGQGVSPDPGSAGDLSHLLRVFLIDPERRIRNIYTPSFLHADTLLADLETVLAEETAPAPGAAAAAPGAARGPGDGREGYERRDYRSDSRALAGRRGRRADLAARLERPPLGLPPVPVPEDNPASEARIALGRKLFYDRRLSANGTISCAMCHVPEQGFTSNEISTAVGIEGRSVRRNAPTIYNVAYASSLFHDGREARLEHQVWGPLLAANEMGNPSVGAVLATLRGADDYAGLFEAAWPGRGLAIETVGMALASYQRTLVSGDSPFDRWRYGGDADALSPAARRGFALFVGKAGCAGCHPVGASSALFTDGGLHNTGVGYRASMETPPPLQEVQVAPGVTLPVARDLIDRVAEPRRNDLGRYEITLDPDDRWRYRTPTLRNVALTAPYMHDGSLASLAEVVAFYDAGGVPNENLDPRVRPLGLGAAERAELVAFLESLTGSDVDLLVADAFAAPIGDLGAAARPKDRSRSLAGR